MSLALIAALLFTTLAAAADEHPGARVYKTKTCVTCHAADGSGNTPTGKSMKARDLRSAEVQQRSDDELAKAITDGQGKMPGFGKALTAQQVRDLVGYIRTLKP